MFTSLCSFALAASDYDRQSWIERQQKANDIQREKAELAKIEKAAETKTQEREQEEALKKARRARIQAKIDAADKAEQQRLEEAKAKNAKGFGGWNEKSAEHQERLIRQILHTKRADELRDELRKVETRND